MDIEKLRDEYLNYDDTQDRINWINRINSIDEPIFRDMLNFMYLSDVQSSQLEILTGAIERAFQAQIDEALTQSHVNDIINSRKALRHPKITEKSLESEALYFRHCLMIEFVRGLGGGRQHREGFGNTLYNHARAAADYVMPMYYDINNQYLPSGQRVLTTTFLDPSNTMTSKTLFKRKLVLNKAMQAVYGWSGAHDEATHFVDQRSLIIRPASEHESGVLTDAGKASLKAAIQAADPTRLSVKPAVVAPVPNMLLDVGASREFDISATFYDDGDTLTYAVASNDDTIATAALSGDTLTVTGVAEGSTSVSLTATDTDSQAVTDEFTVTVGERDGV